jgi:predicted GNAT family acetyltransferase
MQALDRPVWASLTGPHAGLSTGGPLARRYVADVNVFASAADDGPDALQALAALVGPGEQIFIAQAQEIVVPPGLTLIKQGSCIQMVACRKLQNEEFGVDFRALEDANGADMLRLARLTEPGPFVERTHAMGRFIGVHDQGQLVAMAGERFRLPDFVEVSGVCVHPDWRGRGLARVLSCKVASRIQAQGHTPFLHAWETNRAAIALYRSLGFEERRTMHVAVLTR